MINIDHVTCSLTAKILENSDKKYLFVFSWHNIYSIYSNGKIIIVRESNGIPQSTPSPAPTRRPEPQTCLPDKIEEKIDKMRGKLLENVSFRNFKRICLRTP